MVKDRSTLLKVLACGNYFFNITLNYTRNTTKKQVIIAYGTEKFGICRIHADRGSDRIGFRFFPAGCPVFYLFGSFLDFSKSSVSAAFLTEPAVVHNHHSAAFVINFDRVRLYANKYTGASEFRAL